MQYEQLLKITQELKSEILIILQSYDLSNKKQARRALDEINVLYDQLGILFEDVVPQDILQSYFSGMKEVGRSIELISLSALAGKKYVETVMDLSDNALLDLRAAIRTARMNSNTSILDALKEIQAEIRKGVINVEKKRTITAKVAETFNKYGMTSFITSDGKKLPLDYYAEVVTRTNMRNAEVKGAVNQFIEDGQDLVKIGGVTPTCHHCWAHRDVVFSLSGKDERFPAAQGNLPPYHPNCMCEASAYYENEKRSIEVEADIEKAENFNPAKDSRPKNIKDAYDKRQARNRVNNYEKKRYAKMKAILGDEAPKTIGAFKRMKRANTGKYQKLMRKTQLKTKEND